MYVYDYKVNTTTINLCTTLTPPRKHIGQCSEEQTPRKVAFVMVLYCRMSEPACYLGSPSLKILGMRLRREEMVYGPPSRTVATMKLSRSKKKTGINCDVPSLVLLYHNNHRGSSIPGYPVDRKST